MNLPVVLRDITDPVLTVDCEACGRHGEYNVENLKAKHGEVFLVSLFVSKVSQNCSRLAEDGAVKCLAFSPQLARLEEQRFDKRNSYARMKQGL